MNIYRSERKAYNIWDTSYSKAETSDNVFLDKKCPYNKNEMCGSWCALFKFTDIDLENRIPAKLVRGCMPEEDTIDDIIN